jgi:hypothetical protein
MSKASHSSAVAVAATALGILIGYGMRPTLAQVGTPPPPTTPQLAIDIGALGYVPNGQTLFRSSYDSGKLTVGTQFFPRLWYKFGTGSGEAPTIQFQQWTARTGATYKVFTNTLQPVGDLFDPRLKLNKDVEYYIEVSASNQTSAHFALEVRPALDAFQNDGGDSEQNATNLGTLNNVLTHTHQFYTYFDRVAPDLNGSSTTPRPLAPNFQSPNPAVAKAYYSFALPQPSSIQVFTFNQDADTYLVHLKGQSNSTVVQGGSSFLLPQAGTYILEIVDRFTSVSGTNQIRDSHSENFENQSFELKVLNPQSPPPTSPGNPSPGNSGGTGSSSLGPPPTPQCTIIGTQRIVC